jgi:DNA-binding transcriptional MerR regulator
MTEPVNEPWLTAAECAARTGLTVRALRVYEEYGLISPHRTAGGWRCYGKDDLIRLNTITLLKSAGLSLVQIRTVTRLNEIAPSLRHVLEAQVDTWKAKRGEAERGQQIVETALKNLDTQQSLPVDELCNLVRNLVMSTPQSAGPEAEEPRDVSVDVKVLDGYVGFYRWGEFAVLEVTRENTQLFARIDGDVRYELVPQSDTEFAARAMNAHVRFVTDSQERATSQVIHQYGVRVQIPRIDAETTAAIRAKCAERVASQAPLPGSEDALRRLLASIDSGAPNYTEMGPLLAGVIEQQLPTLQAMSRYLGPLRAVTFRGVGQQGWDVYDVERELGTGQWRVLLGANGKIENASVLATDSKLHGLAFGTSDGGASQGSMPGAEAALRRLIDGVRNGAPDYDEMSPLLAQAMRQQLPQLQLLGRRLGEILSIEYRETVVERYDIFDMKREHGSARWRISLAPDGTILSAAAMLTGSSLNAGP